MKKLISVVLVAIMIALCFGGCAKQSPAAAPAAPVDSSSAGQDQPKDSGNYPTKEKPITIKMGFAAPANQITHVNFQLYTEAITEATDGAILFELYPASQLGNEKTLLEGIVSGTVEMAALSANVIATAIPQMNAFCLPFLVPSMDVYWDIVANEEFRAKINEIMLPKGIEFLTTSTTEARAVTATRPARSPKDFSGMKIRVMDGNIFTDIFACFGSGTSVLPFSECYSALQQNVIDGLDTGIAMGVSMKFFEVAKYYIDTNHVYHCTMVVMNNDVMSKLSPEQQQIVREKASVIWDRGRAAQQEEVDTKYKIAVEDYDVEIVSLTDEERAVFRETCQPLYDKYKPIIGEEFYNWYMDYVASKIG